MSKLPSLTGREIITALKKIGFEVIRIRGSHHFKAIQTSDVLSFQFIQVKQLGLDY